MTVLAGSGQLAGDGLNRATRHTVTIAADKCKRF